MVAPMSAAAAAGRAQRSWFTARSVAKATGGDVPSEEDGGVPLSSSRKKRLRVLAREARVQDRNT